MTKEKNKIFIIARTLIIVLVALALVSSLEPVENFLEEQFNVSYEFSNIFKKTLPADAVSVITSKETYRVGEEIFYGVQNRTDKELWVENECPGEPLEVYIKEGDLWKHIKAEADITCTDTNDIKLAPYELKGSSFLPWSDIIFDRPGTYKLEVDIEGYTNSFETEFFIVE